MSKLSDNAILISEDDKLRSDFVCSLIQTANKSSILINKFTEGIPKIIVQFWDTKDSIPSDVQACIETWRHLDDEVYKHILFNDESARKFIAKNFTLKHTEAYNRCYHPAMKSDYFRLCYIFISGGCYVDADDTYTGSEIKTLFKDRRLKLQPLCYDIETDRMIHPTIFMNTEEYIDSWIYYFNNNPLIASPGNLIIKHALERATNILMGVNKHDYPEIQSTTGPGNLTASLVVNMVDLKVKSQKETFDICSDWEIYAKTVWSLNYREDSRNWRLSNQKQFSIEARVSNNEY